MDKSKINNLLPYLVWFLGAFLFFNAYIVRVSSSVLSEELMKSLHIDAFTMGGLSACFYYAYSSMQIPVGILVDRFSCKGLLINASLLCAIGTFLFAEMTAISMGFLSRFIMGLGASFAFVNTLKLILLWFKPERFALLAGLTEAMGMLGAMVGQGPMAVVYLMMGWRQAMHALSLLFLLITLLMFFIIKERNNFLTNETRKASQKVNIGKSILIIFANPQTWLNCFFIGLLYAPSACFGEQWGASFLSTLQGISIGEAGQQTGMIFMGSAIGCPILGWLSDRIKRRLLIMRISVAVCFVLLVIVIYGQIFLSPKFLNPITYSMVLFIYGLFNSGIVSCYALAAETHPHQVTGIALGVTNMASGVLGAVMIPIIGFVLDKLWTGEMLNHLRIFTVKDYQIAFAVLPIGFMVAFFSSFFQKEKRAQ